jgi:anti-sigma B factor antagonist
MTGDEPDFSLAFSRTLGCVVVQIHGPLDVNHAQELDDRLADVIDGQGNRQLVLDLAGMTHVDSAGVGVLVGTLRKLQRRGGRLVLSAASSEVALTLEAAGLDKVFDMTPAWDHPARGGVDSDAGGGIGWGNLG